MPRMTTTNPAGGGRGTLRVPAAVRAAFALFLAILGLTLGPAAVQAGTWTIYPNVVNNTGSTVDNCPAGVAGQGCIFRDSLGILDGNWTKEPVPALPASANLNGDKSTFIAPNFAEGADGYVAYRMPDASQFSIVAEDDQGFTDALNQAYPGCGVSPGGGPSGFTCLATYPPLKEPGVPSSSDFVPNFMFFANDGSAPYTAAGQVCSTTSTSVMCTTGLECTNSGLGCTNRVSAGASVGQWSPTDPNNWMWLNLKNIGNTSVTVTNLGSWRGHGPHGAEQCVMDENGDTCAFLTSGGCAIGTQWCGSDAIQMTVNDGQSGGSVMVMQQAEVPVDMAEDWSAEMSSSLQGSIWGALEDGATEAVSAPRITKLRASTAATRAKAKKAPEVRVSYRNSRPARSVLTVARERAGVRSGTRCVARTKKTPQGAKSCKRWANLPGVGTKTSSRFVWTPSKGKACTKPAKGNAKRGCRQVTTLRGHQQNRDRAGVNRVTISRVAGKKLAPGRYRLTARSLAGRVKGPAASTTFRIGGRS